MIKNFPIIYLLKKIQFYSIVIALQTHFINSQQFMTICSYTMWQIFIYLWTTFSNSRIFVYQHKHVIVHFNTEVKYFELKNIIEEEYNVGNYICIYIYIII